MSNKKILIIKSSSMGDVVHALPVAQDIRQAFPDARIDWVVEESFAEIPALSTAVDGRIITAFRRWRKRLLQAQTWEEIQAVKKELRSPGYDAVIDLQGLIRSALVARWSKAPSWGYSADTVREPLAARFYTHTLAVPESLTPVRRYRVMCARVLGYEIDEDHPVFGLRRDMAPAITINEPYVCLAVNTSRPEKLWAQERWMDLGRRLRDRGLVSAIFWGSDSERLRAETIADQIPDAIVVPRSNLTALAGLLVRARGLVGVDTGLAHLAAALAVPSVGIIVGTSAALFSLVSEGPCCTVGDNGVVPSVDEVFAAFQKVLP